MVHAALQSHAVAVVYRGKHCGGGGIVCAIWYDDIVYCDTSAKKLLAAFNRGFWTSVTTISVWMP